MTAWSIIDENLSYSLLHVNVAFNILLVYFALLPKHNLINSSIILNLIDALNNIT